MNRNEYLGYISEIHELELLLKEIPKDRIIERISLEARLKAAKTAVAKAEKFGLSLTVKLTFRGKPVTDSHGISADFGTKAAGAFSEAISAIAAGTSINLNEKGPIPDKHKNEMLIVGTAVGSFGFEFELPNESKEEDFFQDQTTSVEKAISVFQELLEKAASGSDDDIAEIIEDIPSRAIKKTADFLDLVAQNGALCAVDFKDRQFNFENIDKIRSSTKRLQENEISENKETFIGEFVGVLPYSRTFEFKIENDKLIKGKIAPFFEDPDTINRQFLHKRVKVVLSVKKFGTGRPRYFLDSISEI